MDQNISNILVAVFSVGGAAFFAAIYRAFKDHRAGSWTRREQAIADLERWRKDSDDSREWEAVQHQWWRSWAGNLEHRILVKLGPEELPTRPPYPTREDVVSDDRAR